METQLATNLAEVSTKLTSQLNVGNIVTVIGAGLAIALPMIVLWFGARWVIGKAKKAFRRGN